MAVASSSSTTLPLFWDISSTRREERLDASVKLISALQQFQKGFTPAANATEDQESEPSSQDEENANSDEYNMYSRKLDETNATDVVYAIRRLIRGLASPRESSRIGFAVVLTEILSRLETVTSLQILSLLLNASQSTGSMSGQEERDMFFARLFGLKAIIDSGLLFKEKPLSSTSLSPGSLKAYEAVLGELLALGEKKSWLKESCWWTLDTLLNRLRASEVPWKQEAVDMIIDRVYISNKSWGPEKVALTLRLQKIYPEKNWNTLCGKNFKSPSDILASVNLVGLSRLLKESITDDDDGDSVKVDTVPWKPQVHYVWDAILEALLSPNGHLPSSCNFQDFYRIAVDESLFASSSSPQRKYWGFQIFQGALRKAPTSDLPFLFTPNFMRTWINHLSKNDRHLHKIARQVASDVQKLVESNPTIGFVVVLQLTGTNGSQQFDRITNTKTVESILANLDSDGVQKYLDYLMKQVNEGGDGVATKRTWIVEQLAVLLRRGSVTKDDVCAMTILKWLTTHAFFVVERKKTKSDNVALSAIPEPPFTDELHELCRTKLLACLADLTIATPPTESKEKDEKGAKSGSSVSEGKSWIRKVFCTFMDLQKDTKHVKILRKLEDGHVAVLQTVLNSLDKLQTVTEENAAPARGVELLLCSLALRNLVDKIGEDEWEALKDCLDSSSKLFLSGKKKKGSKKTEEKEEQEPIDLLVDSIIGLLERSNAFSRTMANQSFTLMTSLVKESTMDLILTQLERRDPTAEGEDIEDADDEEMAEGEEASEEEDSTTSDEDEDDSLDEASGDDEDLEEFRQKIAIALDGKGDDDVDESGDDSEEEDDMDDDQMLAQDEQLAALFKSRSAGKSKKDVDAQREATHFKNRVLDLVDAFLKKEAANELVVRCVMPLVDLITSASTDERQLSDKAKGILRSRLAKPKDVPELSDFAKATENLEELHRRARKASSPELLSPISICSIFLSKVLLSSAEDQVIRIYKESLTDFVTRKSSSLNPAFMLDFIRRYPSSSWEMHSVMSDLISKAVNGFRQTQLFAFILAQLTALPEPESKKGDILSFITSVSAALHRTISRSCTSDKPALSAVQMKETLKTGLQICRFTKRIAGETSGELATAWRPASWSQLASELAKSEHFKTSTSLQSTCQQIAQVSKSGDVSTEKKATKRKPDADGEGSGVKPKRRKVKKSAKHVKE